MSKDDIFAHPMLEGDEFLSSYADQLEDLNRQGKLPDLEKEMSYKVYSIAGSSFGGHKSIVLTTNDIDFVTVELGFHKVEGKKHVYPATRALDSSVKDKLEYHGCVTTSGKNLVAHAVGTMKAFGSYFKYTKNCQHFCNKYLESIGLSNETSMTDDQKGMIAATIIAVGSIIMKLFQCARAKRGFTPLM